MNTRTIAYIEMPCKVAYIEMPCKVAYIEMPCKVAYIEMPCKVGDFVALLNGEQAWDLTLDVDGDGLLVVRA